MIQSTTITGVCKYATAAIFKIFHADVIDAFKPLFSTVHSIVGNETSVMCQVFANDNAVLTMDEDGDLELESMTMKAFFLDDEGSERLAKVIAQLINEGHAMHPICPRCGEFLDDRTSTTMADHYANEHAE